MYMHVNLSKLAIAELQIPDWKVKTINSYCSITTRTPVQSLKETDKISHPVLIRSFLAGSPEFLRVNHPQKHEHGTICSETDSHSVN